MPSKWMSWKRLSTNWCHEYANDSLTDKNVASLFRTFHSGTQHLVERKELNAMIIIIGEKKIQWIFIRCMLAACIMLNKSMLLNNNIAMRWLHISKMTFNIDHCNASAHLLIYIRYHMQTTIMMIIIIIKLLCRFDVRTNIVNKEMCLCSYPLR